MGKLVKSVLASLLAFGIMAGGAGVTDAKEVMKVSGSSAVLKSTTSPSTQTLLTLSKGDFVVANSNTNGWALVDFQGTQGAIAQSVLAGSLPYTIKISGSKGGIVIKQKAMTNAVTLANLKYGMVMEDYGSAGNGYSFVRYGNIIGYAQTSFTAAPKATVKYVNAKVNLRSIASSSGEVVGSASKDEKVEVYANIAGWSYIKAGSSTGYVPTANLIDKVQAALKPTTATTAKPSTNTNKPAANTGDASSGYYVIPGAPTSFKNCADMNKYYPSGVHNSHPAYASARDRDKDGWACEK